MNKKAENTITTNRKHKMKGKLKTKTGKRKPKNEKKRQYFPSTINEITVNGQSKQNASITSLKNIKTNILYSRRGKRDNKKS